MRYSIDDSTGLCLTVPRKVARPGVTAPLEDGMMTVQSPNGYARKSRLPGF